MRLSSSVKNLAPLKWAHVIILTLMGGLLFILPMAGSHKVIFYNPQTIGMMSFGIVLLLTAVLSFFQLKKGVARISLFYIILLIASIAILGYSAYYVYDFNRTKGHIPAAISVFIWGGIILSVIIIFKRLLQFDWPRR